MIDELPRRPMQTRRPTSRPRIGKWGVGGLISCEAFPEHQSLGHCTDERRDDEGLSVCGVLEICHRTIRELHRRGARIDADPALAAFWSRMRFCHVVCRWLNGTKTERNLGDSLHHHAYSTASSSPHVYIMFPKRDRSSLNDGTGLTWRHDTRSWSDKADTRTERTAAPPSQETAARGTDS